MKYKSGEEIRVGDQVLIEDGRTPGRVHAVIESENEMAEWGLDEPVMMIESAPFGLVAWPADDEDPVCLVERQPD